MRTRLSSIALALLCAAPAPALANDTAFGGEGAALMPIENTSIRMVEEHVVLDGVVEKNDLAAWNVRCVFTFKNESDQPQTVRMGFPFPEVEASETHPPPGRKATKSLVYDFQAKVAGEPVKVEAAPISKKDLRYRHAWLWDVEFAPGQTIVVENTYLTGTTVDSSFATWGSYVLRTGAHWKDATIGRSRLEVHPSVPFDLCEKFGFGAGPSTPPGARISGEGAAKKLEWDLRDFSPKADLSVCLMTGYKFATQTLVHSPGTLEAMSKKALRILRNTPYARHGYAFKKPAMKAHFDAQWWYQTDPKFTPNRLERWELDLIKEIEILEKKAK